MKLLYSFLKDMQLSLKSWYLYMEIGFALIFVAILIYVVPENPTRSTTVYAHFDLPETYLSQAAGSLSRDGYEIQMLSSREEVETELADDRGSVGLVVSLEGSKIVYDYILQGYENEKFKKIIKTSIEGRFAKMLPGFQDVTTVRTIEGNTERLPTRLNMLPVYLALNAAFMGLFIIAAYIFLDKEEGTIKAFAVTPAKVWHYLLGKMGVMLVTGLISGLIATTIIAGQKAHYFHLIMLIISLNAFGSALGLFIASFFDTMTKAMGWLYMSVIVLAFAAVSYYMPAFSPLIIRILPSYPMLFAFRETLYDVVNLGYVYATVAGFAVLAVILFLLSNYRFKKTLTV